ncbi:MAG: histidine kinase [Sphingobium sp.]
MTASRTSPMDGGDGFLRKRGVAVKRSSDIDPEWLICAGRLLAALFAALAIYLDPTRPAQSLDEAHYVLGAYVAFSLLVTLFPPSRRLASPVHLISHAIDIFALGLLVYLTDELSSPFFPFLPFILLATTMRWGMWGAVLGALVMQVMLIAIGWQDLRDGESELNLLIMRSVYFVVAAAMLGYFGAYRERNNRRLTQLASWSFVPETTDRHIWLRDMLDHAAEVLGAQRLVLAWHDRESRSGMMAVHSADGFHLMPLPETCGWPDQTRRCEDGLRDLLGAVGRADLLVDAPRPRCAPLASTRFSGCLYVIDASFRQEDIAPLAGIIALRIGHELERLALVHLIAGQARDQERMRLAHDLHDSVLQDLAAGALRLKAIGSRLPPAAQESLHDINLVLAQQQRRIRLFVESTGAEGEAPDSVPLASLGERIDDLEKQWDCAITCRISPADMSAPPAIVRELSQLVSEAVANAARHGGATEMDLCFTGEEDMLSIAISDNGSGMACPQETPVRLPRSLSARVEMLKGHIAITRHSPGFALAIEVPLHETA